MEQRIPEEKIDYKEIYLAFVKRMDLTNLGDNKHADYLRSLFD